MKEREREDGKKIAPTCTSTFGAKKQQQDGTNELLEL